VDRYLFTARSVTHAQQMTRLLEQDGIYVKVRRVGSGVTKDGCGYTLEIPARQYARAAERLRTQENRPVKVLFVSGGKTREVAL